MKENIDPKQLIATLSVDALCKAADEYYKKIVDPTPLLAKPFSSMSEAPILLQQLSVLFHGLKLGHAMTVLDFGSGTCWLSRLLNQMNYSTISVDASQRALEIGSKLFQDYPIIGTPLSEPRFVHFNGHTIDIGDGSVDRIICFDMFHHVPNQEEILSEFYRILKPGGIAGFCEPGPFHSQGPQSQYEMKNYNVLENDIILDEIKVHAESAGFNKISIGLTSQPDLELDFNDYVDITANRTLPEKVRSHIVTSMTNTTIFFLTKGTPVLDSRSHIGLRHHLEIQKTSFRAKRNETINFDVAITNTGTAKWLHKNSNGIGVVKLGMHLYDKNEQLIDLDFFRSEFDEDILPGRKIVKNVTFVLTHNAGRYFICLDLVSEGICWFENVGSEAKLIEVVLAN